MNLTCPTFFPNHRLSAGMKFASYQEGIVSKYIQMLHVWNIYWHAWFELYDELI